MKTCTYTQGNRSPWEPVEIRHGNSKPEKISGSEFIQT